MTFTIAVLPGDGIGPEVTREAVRVLRAVSDGRFELKFEELPIGGNAVKQFGSPLPERTLERCLASNAVLLGAVGGPDFDSLPPALKPETGLLGIRKALGGFANLRPAIAYEMLTECSPLRPEVLKGSDILFVRELLGGAYFGQPRGFAGEGASRTGFNTMIYSASEVERVAHVAFKVARDRRKKVTSVDKANVLEVSQLWRQVVVEVSKQYPDVKLEHQLVDSCAMRLVTAPNSFDVVLAENLFGDILSDEAAALTGSLGMLPSATVGGKVNLYEPIHGSAPDIAGKGIANPLGAIATAAMLLRHSMQREKEARAIEQAITQVLGAGYRTADLKRGSSERLTGTEEMGRLVLEAISTGSTCPAGV
ncbi:MAG: 3-isopropylmalate dehydrogenase [Candidatus Korobacteraceae bacterium]|jgi:3-isopropylmalate dehydrogenase